MRDQLKQRRREAEALGQLSEKEYVTYVLSNILEASKNYSFLFKNSKIEFLSYFIAPDETERVNILLEKNGETTYAIPSSNVNEEDILYTPEKIADRLMGKGNEDGEIVGANLYQNFIKTMGKPLGEHLVNEQLKGLEERILSE